MTFVREAIHWAPSLSSSFLKEINEIGKYIFLNFLIPSLGVLHKTMQRFAFDFDITTGTAPLVDFLNGAIGKMEDF